MAEVEYVSPRGFTISLLLVLYYLPVFYGHLNLDLKVPVLKLTKLPANRLLINCMLRLFDIFSCKIAEVTLMSPLNKGVPLDIKS